METHFVYMALFRIRYVFSKMMMRRSKMILVQVVRQQVKQQRILICFAKLSIKILMLHIWKLKRKLCCINQLFIQLSTINISGAAKANTTLGILRNIFLSRKNTLMKNMYTYHKPHTVLPQAPTTQPIKCQLDW